MWILIKTKYIYQVVDIAEQTSRKNSWRTILNHHRNERPALSELIFDIAEKFLDNYMHKVKRIIKIIVHQNISFNLYILSTSDMPFALWHRLSQFGKSNLLILWIIYYKWPIMPFKWINIDMVENATDNPKIISSYGGYTEMSKIVHKLLG